MFCICSLKSTIDKYERQFKRLTKTQENHKIARDQAKAELKVSQEKVEDLEQALSRLRNEHAEVRSESTKKDAEIQKLKSKSRCVIS